MLHCTLNVLPKEMGGLGLGFGCLLKDTGLHAGHDAHENTEAAKGCDGKP